MIEDLDTDITLKNELEGEPGVYGYLVHVNRGRKELNNPPKGRPRYKRKDGKELIWMIRVWMRPGGRNAATTSMST